ncbi:MAG: TonB family protein [Pseudomonadota bacterium]
MPVYARHCISVTAGMLLGCLSLLSQAQEELETVGLAVYTETARDIYVAGLQLPTGAVMQNLMLAPPPKAMEYRIATRRISSRGFSGTLLLQAELGSGGRAPENAINALAQLKQSMKGSLKQGDQFKIYLDEDDTAHFLLNGTELLSIADGGVFDFFYSGWVGEGAASTLREPLLAGTLDPAVTARYEELVPNEARIAAIAAWAAPPVVAAAAPAPSPVTEPPSKPPQDTVLAASPAEAPATEQASAAGSAEAATAITEPEPTIAAAAATTQGVSQTAPESDVVAVVEPTSVLTDAMAGPAEVAGAVEESRPESDRPALQLDDREYQQQLQAYVSDVMRAVYGKVSYPRRAVKYDWEGRVEILARMDASGNLLEAVIDRQSGHEILDKAAQTAVKKASLPELGPVAQEEFVDEDGEGYVISIPITFALQQ